MKDPSDRLDAGKATTEARRFSAPPAPMPYEGIGRALASAFPASDRACLPDDMTSLLEKIDCISPDRHPGGG
jgi:hypothetical protein